MHPYHNVNKPNIRSFFRNIKVLRISEYSMNAMWCMQPKLSSAVAHDGGLKGTAQFGTLFRPLHEIYSLSWHFLLFSLTAGWWWLVVVPGGSSVHTAHSTLELYTINRRWCIITEKAPTSAFSYWLAYAAYVDSSSRLSIMIFVSATQFPFHLLWVNLPFSIES